MANLLVLSKKEMERYNLSEKIGIKGKEVSILLLKDLLSIDEFYMHIRNIFLDEQKYFEYGCLEKNGTIVKMVTKMGLLKAMEQGIKSNKLILNINEHKRLKAIYNLVTFDTFIERHCNDKIVETIDGNEVKVEVSKIISFLTSSEEEYKDFFDFENQPTIYGIPKEYFAYIIKKYLIDNKIFANYIFPPKIVERYNDLYKSDKIDIEALNQINYTEDDNIQNVVINDSLKQEVYRNMPSDINEFEKAIYIYIKLCKILTYDEEFFVFNQSGDTAQKHENINYITTITPQNNRAVCYEFIEIYAKFLEELGIKFTSHPLYAQKYGGQHAKLDFRYGKFLVSCDPLTSIIDSDLLHAKLNQPVNGILCKNENKNTMSEFQQIVSKVYMMLEEDKKVEYVETLEDLLKEYNYDDIDLELVKRIRVLLGKLFSSNLMGLDALTYSIQLSKTIFDELERHENIKINIIKNNNPIDKMQDSMASAIITINEVNVNDNISQNSYYLYIPGQRLKKIELDELIKKMSDEEFEYIEYNDPKIPGVVLNEKSCCTDKVKRKKR